MSTRRSNPVKTKRTPANIAAVMNMIEEDRRVDIDKIAAKLDLCFGTVHIIFRKDLNYSKTAMGAFAKSTANFRLLITRMSLHWESDQTNETSSLFRCERSSMASMTTSIRAAGLFPWAQRDSFLSRQLRRSPQFTLQHIHAVKKHRRIRGGGFAWDHRRSSGLNPMNDIDDIPEAVEAEDGGNASLRILVDPCREMSCGAGRECHINEETDEGACRCTAECGRENDPRRQVCSNHNETFPTDCDLYRAQCLCEEGSPSCQDPEKMANTHIEYYGECRMIPDCSKEELIDFPRRMREWLFNVMKELAEREELSNFYTEMEREAEEDIEKRWENAAVWKWCDLDGHPSDNSVSRHELFPVKAPLQSLEHCIGDFLDNCDSDGDHKISLKEWAKCLELEGSNLEERCEELNGDN
eukprot:maker-scaffold1165_size57908-snap-gene-0.11 protein:Tk03772 transcript:maker-scaffold1165_size57908-snap-gene-0.11-mRNA-1 annotation:"Sparc"